MASHKKDTRTMSSSFILNTAGKGKRKGRSKDLTTKQEKISYYDEERTIVV